MIIENFISFICFYRNFMRQFLMQAINDVLCAVQTISGILSIHCDKKVVNINQAHNFLLSVVTEVRRQKFEHWKL